MQWSGWDSNPRSLGHFWSSLELSGTAPNFKILMQFLLYIPVFIKYFSIPQVLTDFLEVAVAEDDGATTVHM